MSVELNHKLQRVQAQYHNPEVYHGETADATRRRMLDEIADLLKEMGATPPATRDDARAVQEAALAHAGELRPEVYDCFERVLTFLSKPPPH